METKQPSTKVQIRNLVLIFSSGILCALLLILAGLYYYEPGRLYSVNKVLIAPELLAKSGFSGRNPTTGKQEKTIFSTIVFSTRNRQGERIEKIVDASKYKLFFDLIRYDKSLSSVTSSDRMRFYQTIPMTLTIYNKSKHSLNDQEIVFQQVQFDENGNYYRISLHSSSTQAEWAYFYHVGIKEKITQLLKIV